MVYGYSRSVDYYGHYEIGVEATLSDPEWQGVGYAWEWGQFDVYAEVSSNVESSGDYKVDGEHYYWHYYWQDWYWDGSTSALVYGEASEPEIWSIGPAGAWEAGSLVNVTVTGQGFLGQVAWACGGADWDNLFVASDGLITGDIQVSPWYNPGVYICVGAAVSMAIAVFQPPPPPCPHPAAEVSVAGYWCSTCVGGVFTASLKDAGGVSPPNGKYQGRTVRERLSDLVDTCFFEGAEWRAVLPDEAQWSSWPVGSINGYGSDLIDWEPEPSAYYQSEVRDGRYSSCYVSIRQKMEIEDCNGLTWAEYHSQDTRNTITSSGMRATRGNEEMNGPIGD